MTRFRVLSAAVLFGTVGLVPAGAAAPAAAAPPPFTVTPVVSGLAIPWDVVFLPDGTMLYDQRAGGFSIRTTTGTAPPTSRCSARQRAGGMSEAMSLCNSASPVMCR